MPCNINGMPSKPVEFPREKSLGYQVNHLARLLAAALRERIEPHGVVPGQFAQLLALLERDGISQSELCDQVRIDQSTMAHTLKRMERDGLVSRSPDPGDQRRALIRLTPRRVSWHRRWSGPRVRSITPPLQASRATTSTRACGSWRR